MLQLFFLVQVNAAESNGIKFESYKGFQNNWKQVTVRYRKDTDEQRFVYANDIAWADFKSNSKKFSEGAVFAKIGMGTIHDPSFLSSVIPTEINRIQVMVKNSKKYKRTDGWGYALFNAKGEVLGGEIKDSDVACHACHKAVPQKDFVFSIPIGFQINKDLTTPGSTRSFWFEILERAKLPPIIQEALPKEIKVVRNLKGVFQEKIIPGTINELYPLMTSEAKSSQLPSFLIQKDGAIFMLVMVNPNKSACENAKTAKEGFWIYHNAYHPEVPKLEKSMLCQ